MLTDGGVRLSPGWICAQRKGEQGVARQGKDVIAAFCLTW